MTVRSIVTTKCFRFHFLIASNSSLYSVIRMFCVMFIRGFVFFITFLYVRNVIARIIYINRRFGRLVFFFAKVQFCRVVDKICGTPHILLPSETINTNGQGHKTQNKMKTQLVNKTLKSKKLAWTSDMEGDYVVDLSNAKQLDANGLYIDLEGDPILSNKTCKLIFENTPYDKDHMALFDKEFLSSFTHDLSHDLHYMVEDFGKEDKDVIEYGNAIIEINKYLYKL